MEKLTDIFLATERQLRGCEKAENMIIKVHISHDDHPRLREFLEENGWNGISFPTNMSTEELKQLQINVLYEIENVSKRSSYVFTD